MTVVVDHISGSHFHNDAAGHMPPETRAALDAFLARYGGLFQFYELGNEPCMFGGGLDETIEVARYLNRVKPRHVQLVAPGWAYGGGKGTPKNWDADPALRRQVEALSQLTNGHSYGYSYADDRGGSFVENLNTFGGVRDGWLKPYLNTETGTNDWHSEEKGPRLPSSQPHAQAFDRILRAHLAVVDRAKPSSTSSRRLPGYVGSKPTSHGLATKSHRLEASSDALSPTSTLPRYLPTESLIMPTIRHVFLTFWLMAGCLLMTATGSAATYFVAQGDPSASDANLGASRHPWKTLSRAARAPLKPGDIVLVKAGVYRETVDIHVSGQPGKPITFAAAPGQKVVVKGSDVVTGQWERFTGDPSIKEPYPNASASVWRIKLRDNYFAGLEPKERYISSVFQDDTHSLQQIGEDHIYKNEKWQEITNIGRGLNDIYPKAYFFDPPTQMLYVCIAGDPNWSLWEIGTRGFVFHIEKAHDVILRGFQVRHNRQPGGQWSMATASESERVLVEDCDFSYSDFCGFSFGRCKNCTLRNCTCSYNGDTGVALGWCMDCSIQGCSILFNNTRHFEEGWAAGGIKNIPENIRCSVDGCEVAHNHGPGVWFDTDNVQCRITNNVIHDNESNGIHYEINAGGGLIANNLIFSNGGRGIYISGSQHVWIVYNTVAENNQGIVVMPREAPNFVTNDLVRNNLVLYNYVAGPSGPLGCDLTLFMGDEPDGPRTALTNHSDYNGYLAGDGTPTLRQHWNPDNALSAWQKRYREDLHSRALPLDYSISAGSFRLDDAGAAAKLGFADPLPAQADWRQPNPSQVGASMHRWPSRAKRPTDTAH